MHREFLPPLLADKFLENALQYPERSFHGVLAWDLLDYFDPEVAPRLMERLSQMFHPGGAMLAMFHSRPAERFHRYRVVDSQTSRTDCLRPPSPFTPTCFRIAKSSAFSASFAPRRLSLAAIRSAKASSSSSHFIRDTFRKREASFCMTTKYRSSYICLSGCLEPCRGGLAANSPDSAGACLSQPFLKKMEPFPVRMEPLYTLDKPLGDKVSMNRLKPLEFVNAIGKCTVAQSATGLCGEKRSAITDGSSSCHDCSVDRGRPGAFRVAVVAAARTL